MTRMTLRALHEHTEPARRAHLACWNTDRNVVTHTVAKTAVGDRPSSVEREAEQCRPADHVERAEPERAPGIQALGAVMPLVRIAPQRARTMQAAVPGPDTRLIEKDADRGAGQGAETAEVEQLKRCEPLRPQKRRFGNLRRSLTSGTT